MASDPKTDSQHRDGKAGTGKAAAAGGVRGGIQSLERASAILDAVAQRPQGIGLADLSQAVGLHTSTTFHLVKTLVALDLLTQSPDSKLYRIGGRIFMLAAGALDQNALLDLGTPILEQLSADTGNAAHLAVRSRNEIAVIARTAATGLLQLSGYAGANRPAHATAIGKLLLAAMPEEQFDRLLVDLPLPKFTEKTITDRRTLRQEIEAVRRSGLARDNCELDPDVQCIAVPVRDFAGRCVAAMGISGPAWRMAPDILEEKSQRLQAAAAELSARLGYLTT